MTLGSPWPEWKCLSFPESVFSGIGVNQQRFQPASLGGERLEAAIAVRYRIAYECDFVFQIDTVRLEPVVVGRIPAGSVDEFSGHVARGAHAEVGDAGVFRGVWILRVRVLFQRRFVDCWRRHRDADFARPRQQHVVAMQLYVVESPCAIAVSDEVGEFLVAHRTGGVWLVGEIAEESAGRIATETARERCFKRVFRSGGSGGEAADRPGFRRSMPCRVRRRGLCAKSRRREREDGKSRQVHKSHVPGWALHFLDPWVSTGMFCHERPKQQLICAPRLRRDGCPGTYRRQRAVAAAAGNVSRIAPNTLLSLDTTRAPTDMPLSFIR